MSLVDNLKRWEDAAIAKAEQDARRRFDEAVVSATARMDTYLEEHLMEIVNTAIDEFYEWEPIRYRRRYSMYDLLKIVHEDGKTFAEFDPSVMAFRSDGRGRGGSGYNGENGLYDQVFRKGWHGGAAKGPGHPEPGFPYYRTPTPEYRIWGRSASVEAESPLEAIKRRTDTFSRNTGQNVWKRLVEEEAAKMGLKKEAR